MIGTFTLLNTLTLHLLRLAPPTSYIKKRLRRVLQQDRSPLTYGPPERWNGRVDEESGVDEYGMMEEEDTGERRWQAAVAGAVGSLGLLWEQKERRAGVAQQYVRDTPRPFPFMLLPSSAFMLICFEQMSGCSYVACKRRIMPTPAGLGSRSHTVISWYSASVVDKSCLRSCYHRKRSHRNTTHGEFPHVFFSLSCRRAVCSQKTMIG
jgi:hypothetical protein